MIQTAAHAQVKYWVLYIKEDHTKSCINSQKVHILTFSRVSGSVWERTQHTDIVQKHTYTYTCTSHQHHGVLQSLRIRIHLHGVHVARVPRGHYLAVQSWVHGGWVGQTEKCSTLVSVYVCMYVCMYVCRYVCYAYVCMCGVYACVYAYVCMCGVYACMMCMHLCIHASMYVCMYVGMHICIVRYAQTSHKYSKTCTHTHENKRTNMQ
jgi:hypothetical protein